jgi:hypothetical protein
MFLRGRPLGDKLVIGVAALILVVVVCSSIYAHNHPLPPPSPAEQLSAAVEQQKFAAEQQRKAQRDDLRRYLCREAAACKKYDTVRLECATAGNFKTCLRIKMDNVANFSEICSGYNEGAPALPPSPDTPNVVECFFLTWSK